MNQLPKIKINRNSRRFRHRLIDRYRMGLYEPFQIWQLYGINRSLLHKWNCQYHRYRFLTYPPMPKKQTDQARIAELERKLKEAETAYEDEKLARQMFEKMIRIAEEQFQIPIRKKPGAKQLRKDDETTRS
ncbi:MAG: hypothetical protein R3B93_18000 [Bacteroidia bacterium]